MTLGLLGKKLGMTRIHDGAGSVIPVTVIQAGPCPILQVKTTRKDGYDALQLGFEAKPQRKVNRPMAGHFKGAGVEAVRLVREFRTSRLDEFEPGQTLDLSIFEVGERIDVIGVSKGRGFAGAQKRHGSSRGPESHGSRYHRKPGSQGASASPSHVFKGKKSPGQMGATRVTAQNLTVVDVDKERNLLVVRGSVPGHNNGYVMVRKSVKEARRGGPRKQVT
jgi:large subunit ribosomal protein L3